MIVFLNLLLFSLSSAAAENELQLGKTHDGMLRGGKADSYFLLLKAGDFVETKVETHGTNLIITIYDRSGNKARGFRLNGPGRKIGFIANDAGQYRMEVSHDSKANDGPYSLTLTRVVTLTERAVRAPVPETYESLRIKTLRAALDLHDQNSVTDFWKEMRTKGGPLIEPLQGDKINMLVTFLFEGNDDTKNVQIIWVPYSPLWPDGYAMIKLAGTDVWYKTLKVDGRERFVYQLAVNAPIVLPSGEQTSDEIMSVLAATFQADPLNSKHWFVTADSPDVPLHNGISMVEMPDAPTQPWLSKRKDVPSGNVEKRQFKSALLKNEREISIYTPAGYSKDAKPYSLAVIFDGERYVDDNFVPAPTILDNLIADKRIPPIVAILISNAPGDARSRELTCNREFSNFLTSEVLPWVHGMYNVTANPRQTVVGGSSYGGEAATCAAFHHPEAFGNVLSQSGSYWWTPPKSDNPLDFDPNAEPNYVAKQFIASPKLPIRFYMDAGSEELSAVRIVQGLLITNQYLRDVLLAKGYDVHFQEFHGGHDYLSWRGTLSDGLIALMGSTTESQEQSNVEH